MKLEKANEELIYFIEKYSKIISWELLFNTYIFSEEYILNNITKIFLSSSENPNLTIEFIEKYSNLISWVAFSKAPRSLDIIDKFIDHIDWFYHSSVCLPEVFEKYKNKINIVEYCYSNQYITKEIVIKYIEELSIKGLIKNESIDNETKNYIRMFI